MASLRMSNMFRTATGSIFKKNAQQITGAQLRYNIVNHLQTRTLRTETQKPAEDYLDPEWVASIKFGTLKHKRYLLSLDYIESIKRSEVTFFLTGEFPTMEASTKFRIEADKCGFVTRQVKTSILQVISSAVNLPQGIAGGKLYMLTLKEGLNGFTPANIGKLEKLIGPYNSSKIKEREVSTRNAAFHLIAAQVQGETMTRDSASVLLAKMKECHPLPGEEVVDYQRVFIAQLVAGMNTPAQSLVRPLEQMLGEIPRTLSSAGGAMSTVLRQVEQLKKEESNATA